MEQSQIRVGDRILITTERANELKTRQLNIAAFYLKYVEF